MKMIKAIVRPEKYADVLKKLSDDGYRAATRYGILGRGKQRGLKVENVYYDEIPKEMIMVVVEDRDVESVIGLIVGEAKTSTAGAFGDGKIFACPWSEP